MTTGTHVASLNLFLEDDGKLYVTVASSDLDQAAILATIHKLPQITPHDQIIELVKLAENIR